MTKAAHINSSWYRPYLACPDCKEALSVGTVIECSACNYRKTASAQLEIKPDDPSLLEVSLSRSQSIAPDDALNALETNPPAISYAGPAAARDSGELISEINRYLGNDGSVLDLGCGPADQAVPLQYSGYQYVGIDYANHAADILADAHAIPFKDATFDCVMSYAVLEHLHNPFIAIHEIERVLKSGGIYVGTVSQGEPFHGSYFHHTPWGFLSLISSTSTLQVERLWPGAGTLGALSRMSRYPKLIKWAISAIDAVHRKLPFLAPRKMKWPAKQKSLDELYMAGSLCFVVKKR